jgi:alpha-tubulin suppressor-like RCC1 family protein
MAPSARAPLGPSIVRACQGAKPGQHVCDGKAELQCSGSGSGTVVRGCPDACTDGVCTCAFGPEPVCTAQPTGPCTDQGPNVPILDIALGRTHTCALLEGGCVRCWTGSLVTTGSEASSETLGAVAEFRAGSGQLGIPNKTRCDQRALWDIGANVRLGGKAIAISAGEQHTCALLEGGCVRCWGENSKGQLGLGNTENIGDYETPDCFAPVRLGAPARAVSLGANFSCALLVDGNVRCWGSNDYGQLGLGNNGNVGEKASPLSVCPLDLGEKALSIAASYEFTCAILASRHVRCWGRGAVGQPVPPMKPVAVNPPTPVENKATWIGDNEAPVSVPPVSLPLPAIDLAVASHACALLEDNSIYCWGDNEHYALGFDSPGMADTPLPMAVKFPPIAVGGLHASTGTCAITLSGATYCVGSDVGRSLYDMRFFNGQPPSIHNGALFPGLRRIGGNVRSKRLVYGLFQDGPCALVTDTKIRCWNLR